MEAKKYTYARIAKDDALVCFVDHQTGLFSLVQDFPPEEFKNSVLALAATAELFKLPVILTTSFEQGPNGPLIPDLKKKFPSAPYIPRPGQINAWDNEDFVNAIKKTGKKQLILAGIVTEVCVVFPALAAREAGYEVFIATDACGTFNKAARYAAWNRMSQAGVQLMNWFSISAELQRDWRDNGAAYATLLSNHATKMYAIMESYKAKKQ